MYQPEVYGTALSLMILSMLCWGSWANALKLCPGYSFQLFYWDYLIGLIGAAVTWGFTFGSFGNSGPSFLADITKSSSHSIVLAMIGGGISTIAALLLVAAIDIAGLAVAFPIAVGLALVIGAVSSYVIAPKGNLLLLFGGIALLVAAIVFDAVAYRLRESSRQAMSKRGIIISLISGGLTGCFYPFVYQAMAGENALGPYAAVLFLILGGAVCAIPLNLLLMRMPLNGTARVSMAGYLQAPMLWHGWAVLGGTVWCTGAVANSVASRAHIVGPAVSYSISHGATMISACWGIFVWREFSRAPSRAKAYLAWMFIFFLCGLGAIAAAPLF